LICYLFLKVLKVEISENLRFSSQGRRELGGAIGFANDCLNSAPPQDRAFDRFEADAIPFATRCSYRLSFDQAAKGSAQ
jgi:hypothetical protein